MANSIEDRSAKILIIESFSAIRQVMSEQLKQLGFTNINGVANTKDALGIMEADIVDWVFCSTNLDSPENNIQLLSLISSHWVLKHMRVTMFLDENELDLIPYLYEKGLMSHIIKPTNKSKIQEYLGDFFKRFEECGWNDVKFSAGNLRMYLESNKNYRSLIQLEKGLLTLFPGDCEFLLRMAPYLEKIGEIDQAKNILKQVKMIDESRVEEVDKLSQELFEEVLSIEDLKSSDINILGVENAVIVDPDEGIRNDIKALLEDFGVKNIGDFKDGKEAWESMKNHDEPDLIIMEWRIPKVSGPVLLQRIRDKFPAAPVVVLTKLIADEDKPLIQELGIESIQHKPINIEDFKKDIIFLKQQESLPTDTSILERKIKQFLKARKLSEATQLRDQYLASRDIAEIDKKRIRAEFHFFNEEYLEARNLAIDAIKADPESLYLLNFIGKCLMKLKDFQAAVLCFKKAQAISPQNVDRICEIATASFEIGDKKGMEEALQDGKSIDANNDKLLNSEAGIRIQEGDKKKAMELLGKMDSVNEIVAFMNNKAVAFTKNGMIEDGVQLYEKTIESLPESKLETKSLVMYNHALALAKDEKLEKAKDILEQIIKLKPKRIFRKTNSLKLRVERAIERKEPLSFITDDKSSSPTETAKGDAKVEESSAVIGYIQSNPGEICCYKVFINPDEINEKWKDIDQSIPRFVARKSIEKAEDAGLDKMSQNS